jgi:hypothetical protein
VKLRKSRHHESHASRWTTARLRRVAKSNQEAIVIRAAKGLKKERKHTRNERDAQDNKGENSVEKDQTTAEEQVFVHLAKGLSSPIHDLLVRIYRRESFGDPIVVATLEIAHF